MLLHLTINGRRESNKRCAFLYAMPCYRIRTPRKFDMLIEGSAAVVVASYLKMREHFAGKTIVIIISGANINLETLKSIL